MKLRKLELKDAPLMLGWMHDETVIKYMQADFRSKTEDDCKNFISDSWDDKENLHLAIVDDQDVYQGTVSLKHITDSSAELAITVRASAMGKGIAKEAMRKIIKKGFLEKNLSQIYWCVSLDNKRAIHFYDKNGYCRVSPEQLEIRGYSKKQIYDYLWYQEMEGNQMERNKTKYGRSFSLESIQ